MNTLSIIALIAILSSLLMRGISKNKDFRHKEKQLMFISQVFFFWAVLMGIRYVWKYLETNGIYLKNLIEEWVN